MSGTVLPIEERHLANIPDIGYLAGKLRQRSPSDIFRSAAITGAHWR